MRFLAQTMRSAGAEARIDVTAGRLIGAIRARIGGLGGIEDFLHAYALSTKEGLALMVLAEALLRIPDAATADRLIEDKLAAADWSHHDKSSAFLVTASAWTLGMTARIIQPGETPEGIVESLVKRLGMPAVRTATRRAMRLLGSHFVLGQTIGEALGARRRQCAIALFVRHAGRNGAHGRRRHAIFSVLRRCHRSDRQGREHARREGGAVGSANARARDFGQAVGAASALRAIVAPACARRIAAAAAGAGAACQKLRSQFHGRCRGSRPARIVD